MGSLDEEGEERRAEAVLEALALYRRALEEEVERLRRLEDAGRDYWGEGRRWCGIRLGQEEQRCTSDTVASTTRDRIRRPASSSLNPSPVGINRAIKGFGFM
jgi:hypothetical protein